MKPHVANLPSINKKAIALVGGGLTIGGAEIFNRRLLAFFGRKGLHAFSLNTNSYMRDRKLLTQIVYYMLSLVTNSAKLASTRPDKTIVSCANFLDIIAAYIFTFVRPKDSIFAVAHFNYSWKFWRSPRCVSFLRHASKRFRLFCIAPTQKRFFEEHGIRLETDLFPNIFGQRRHACSAPKPERARVVAIYVGRIVPEKGVAEATAFLQRISGAAFPVTLRLVGECSSEMRQLIADHAGDGLEIDFVGWRTEEEVSNELVAADFFISFSRSDTLPLSFLEAAAHGLPIVAPKNSVTEDVEALLGGVFFIEPDAPISVTRAKISEACRWQGASRIEALLARNDAWLMETFRPTLSVSTGG